MLTQKFPASHMACTEIPRKISHQGQPHDQYKMDYSNMDPMGFTLIQNRHDRWIEHEKIKNKSIKL